MARTVLALLLLLLLLLLFYTIAHEKAPQVAHPPPPAPLPRALPAPAHPPGIVHRALEAYVTSLLRRFAQRLEQRHAARFVREDPQNVHDSAVVAHVTRKYQRLEALTEPEMLEDWRDHFDDLLEATRAEISRETTGAAPQNEQVHLVLASFARGNSLSSLPQNQSDAEVLIRTWHRINHAQNATRRPDLVHSLQLQLLDMLEEGHVVCVTGRVSRLLSVFTLADADEELARPEQDSKEYLQAILARTGRLLDDLFEDPEFAEYKDTDELPPAVVAELKKRVEASLRQEYASLAPALLDNFVGEAVQGIS